MGEFNWIHGRAVDRKTRALRFVSVSALNSGDPKSGGCQRKWVYEKILGKKPPSTKQQEEGAANHAMVANYLTTGEMNISQKIAKGMHMLPPPKSQLLVEWDLLQVPGVAYPNPLTEAHSPQLLANAPIKIAGVPLLGSIDCAHALGVNYGAEDVEVTHDPDGTVEVCDWKFVGGTKFLKKADSLHEDTQLALYAHWVYAVRPQTPIVRVSLGYFPDKGNARKVSALVSREKIAPQVEHAGGVVRLLAEAAKCTDIEQVDANTEACDSYGGCFHASYCTAPKRKSMTEYFGQTAADSFYGQQQGIIPVASLLQRSNANAAPGTNPPPSQGGSLLNPGGGGAGQTSVQVAPAPAPTPGPTPEQIAAEQARLAEEERQARIRALVPPTFAQDCQRVREWNRGFPLLKGNAAQAYALIGGQSVAPDYVFPGHAGTAGDISYVILNEPHEMAALVNDLLQNFGPPPAPAQTAPATTPPPTSSLLAPGTPASDPALAAANPDLRQAALGQPLGSFTMTVQPTADAVAQTMMTNPAVTGTDVGTSPAEPATKPATKTRTRTAKPKAATGTLTTTLGTADNQRTDEAAEGIHLYIDVATTIPTDSLNDWAQEQADKLAQKFGAIDVRCAPEDGPLGYEKWRGALAAFIRDAQATPLAPGHYSIDTRYSAVMTIIAEGLSIRARQSGGTVTRSVR